MALSKYVDALQEWSEPALAWSAENPRLAIGAAAASLATLYYIKQKISAPRLPPGPPAYPIIGSMLSLKGKFHEDLRRFKEQYGDVFTIWFGSNPTVVLASYDAIKEGFLTSGEDFASRPPNPPFMKDLQDGFSGSTYGENYVRHKKFAVANIRSLGGLKAGADGNIVEEMSALLQELEKTNQEPVDISDIALLTTTNVMSGILFNECLSHDDPKLHELRDLVINFYAILNEFSMYEFFFPTIVAKIFTRDKCRRFNAALAKLDVYMDKQVVEHRKTFDPNNLRDLVDVYLNKPEIEIGKPLYHTISMLLPDSIDSVSLFMRWTVLYLGHHPDVQKKIQAEIDDVVGPSQMITIAERSKLKYTDAVMYEVMRTSDCSIGTGFHCPTSDGLKFRGYDMPKNVSLFGCVYNAHKDAKTFPDPEKFNPGRFLDEKGELVNTNFVIPFGLGRRMCLGESLVKLELFLFLANVMRTFSIKFPADEPSPPLEPAGGMIQYPHKFKAIFVPRD